MKKIIIILLLATFCAVSYGQSVVPVGAAKTTQHNLGGYWADSVQILPKSFANYSWLDSAGRIWFQAGKIYYHDGTSRIALGTGTGTVSSVGSGYGLLGGPITSTGTMLVDTSKIVTYYQLHLAQIDTTSLSNRINKKEDTSGVAGNTNALAVFTGRNSIGSSNFWDSISVHRGHMYDSMIFESYVYIKNTPAATASDSIYVKGASKGTVRVVGPPTAIYPASVTWPGNVFSVDTTSLNRLVSASYLASFGYGTVASVSGVSNRISSTGGANPVIDISPVYVGQASISILGSVVSGNWQSTAIAANHGGTGLTAYTSGDILYATSSTTTLSKLGIGSTNQVLMASGGLPVWSTITPTTITLTGDVTGSGTSTIATTLAAAGTAGTYGDATHIPVFTTDSKGRVISVTSTAIGGGTITSITGGRGITGGTITTTGTFGLDTSGSYIWASPQTIAKPSIGANRSQGLNLFNSTLATVGNPQYSPALYVIGNSFSTSITRSQASGYAVYSTAISSSSVLSNLVFDLSVDSMKTWVSQMILKDNVGQAILYINGSVDATGMANTTGGSSLSLTGSNNNASRAAILLTTFGTNTFTSGTTIGTIVTNTYNEASGSTNNYDFVVNRVGTVSTTGIQRLLSMQTGGSEKAGIDNNGAYIETGSGTSGWTGRSVFGSLVDDLSNVVQVNGTIKVTSLPAYSTGGYSYVVGNSTSSQLQSLSVFASSNVTLDTFSAVGNTTKNVAINQGVVFITFFPTSTESIKVGTTSGGIDVVPLTVFMGGVYATVAINKVFSNTAIQQLFFQGATGAVRYSIHY